MPYEPNDAGLLHQVYWNEHGCKWAKGHAVPCKCDCGSVLQADHKNAYGEDLSSAVGAF